MTSPSATPAPSCAMYRRLLAQGGILSDGLKVVPCRLRAGIV